MSDDEQGRRGRGEGAKSLLPEGLRKAIQSGANALFTGDEGGKKSLGELRLPKEAMQFLYHQAERGRKDLFRSARHEMRRVMSSMDMRGELRRALVGLRVQVKAEITFEDKETQVAVTEHQVTRQDESPVATPAVDAQGAGPSRQSHGTSAHGQETKPRRKPRPPTDGQ